MPVLTKEHKNDYAKTDSHLFAWDGAQWISVLVEGDGSLSSILKAWSATALDFANLQVNAAGELKVTTVEPFDYTTRVYTATGYTYIAKAAPGSSVSSSVWQVARIDASGNKLYANGAATFVNRADAYAGLNYS
jgi:hypothetical protein